MENNDNTRALMATIDRLVAERDAAEALARARDHLVRLLEYAAQKAERRESELGLQVVAQAARLRLAESTINRARAFIPSKSAAAPIVFAAWDAVPGAT